MAKLLGPDGQPINRAALAEEVATPTLTGVRSLWSDTVASGLTPSRLASILMRANDGDIFDYLTLAEEMEEREPHYGSVLGTRKRAISGLDVTVEAASDEARDQEIADAVRDLVNKPIFGEMLDDLLDGLGKGFSAVEMMWGLTQKKRMMPVSYEWRDPHFFQFDRITKRELMLRDDSNPDGVPLPPHKFIIHTPRLKAGIPIRGGLARLASWSFIFKSYGVKDWMAFVEVFGMPLRLGRYGPSATKEDKETLLRAVANLGSDGAAIIPESMRIEFPAVVTGDGSKVFRELAEWVDKQTSKAVLGQTMTTDDGASLAQGQVHNDVRRDIQVADARQTANTINRFLVQSFVDFNFGTQENYPAVRLPVIEPEDTTELATALEKLVPLGLKVETSVIRDKLGLPDPADDADVLQAAVKPQATDRATNRHRPGCPCCGTVRARNSVQVGNADGIDRMINDELNDGWEPVMSPLIDPVEKLLSECKSYEEAMERLPELAGSVDPAAIIESLTRMSFTARAQGDVTDDLD